LAVDFFIVRLQSGVEPQNTESAGGGNIEVLKTKILLTSKFSPSRRIYEPEALFDVRYSKNPFS
jgi:hypothetical protein